MQTTPIDWDKLDKQFLETSQEEHDERKLKNDLVQDLSNLILDECDKRGISEQFSKEVCLAMSRPFFDDTLNIGIQANGRRPTRK